MVDTVNIVGNVRLPDNSIPRNADIVFTLTGAVGSHVSTDAVIPAPITAPIANAGGAISVSIAPNTGPWQNTRYRITVIEYAAPDKLIEWLRHELGVVKITAGGNIGPLVPVTLVTKPYAPLIYRKGDTIALGMQSLNDDGTIASLSGVTIAARMRHAVTGVEVPLVVDNILPAQGLYRVFMADTSALSVGNYLWNLSFTANGEKTSTDFNELRIVEALA